MSQTIRQKKQLSEWRDSAVSNVGIEFHRGPIDNGSDDLGSMRAVIWCALITAALLVSSCVIQTRLTLAHAQTLTAHIIVHGLSWHNNRTNSESSKYNERNIGAGLRIDMGALANHTSVQIGRYRNSYYKHSTYLIADCTPVHVGAVQAGAFAGATTGYPMTDGRPMPAVGLVARATWGRFSAAVRAAPGKNAHGVAAIELGVRL